MMIEGDNGGSKWGGKKVEGEDSVRTVDCLRGRLLAERLASRNAKEEAEQLGKKLMELENMLKQEAKSRNRAEKKLKFLFKKLESMNISYVSDGSEYSGLVDKSDISSLSTTTSLGTQESKQNGKSEQGSQILNQENDSQIFLLSFSDDNISTIEGSSSSGFEAILPDFKGQGCEMGQNEKPRSPKISDNFEQNIAQNPTVDFFLFSEKSSHMGSDQNYDDSNMDEQSSYSDICYHSFQFSTEDGLNKEDDQDDMSRIDNSMALVAVDMPQKNRTIDPEVLDSAVKEVLDALKHAKEQLQSSIERKCMNMIRVG